MTLEKLGSSMNLSMTQYTAMPYVCQICAFLRPSTLALENIPSIIVYV